jgi:hypothetical protein
MGIDARAELSRACDSIGICCNLSGGRLFGFFTVLPLETLDATRCVDQLLFPREERVAVRADFHVNLFLRRTRGPCGPAGASDMAFDIFGMNSFFHFYFSFYLNKSENCLQP